MKNLIIKTKPSFMLLEVLICFALVVLCFLPLIYPHVFMLKSQKQFEKRVEFNHVTNLIYAEIIEQLYRNEIDWNAIMNGTSIPISDAMLQKVHFDGPFPYNGSFSFREEGSKSNEKKTLIYYKLGLTISFAPKKSPPNKSVDQKNTNYEFIVFVERNLGAE